jgi:xylulokinase
MWLDVEKRAWSPALLALAGLHEGQMPRLVEGSDAGGALNASAAAALGLPQGIVVAGGGGDNAASAVGMGTVDAGEGFLSSGTSGVLFVVTPRYQPNAASATHAFCHALPRRWHQMSVMLSAASCLQWAAGALGLASASAVEAKAASLSPGQRATAPLFLPYLSGERTPHNDAHVRGSFHGLSHNTDQAALAYAVIEGVTFGLKDGLRALQVQAARPRSSRCRRRCAQRVLGAATGVCAASGHRHASRVGCRRRAGCGPAALRHRRSGDAGLPQTRHRPHLPQRCRRTCDAG